MDLDAQMATIAATMNTTKAAVGPLKDLILDLALDPKLTVNATDAANAIQLLAQNGVTMKEIMDGAAKSTVALANATGADFGTAANIASGVMKVFNIDAANMATAIDGITGVTNQSKFTIDDYGQAFAQAGGIAAGMGLSLQDFNTVIAASADNFNSGSDAGTSFKTLLQRLSNPTDEAKAAMQQYGISLFDAEGKMRPLKDVAQQLNNVFQGTVTVTESVGGATKKEAQAAETASKNIAGLTADIETNQKQLQLYNDQLALEIGYYGEGSPKVRQRQIQIEKLSNTIGDQQQKLGDYQSAISLVDGAEAKLVSSTKTLTEAEKAQLAAVIGGADASRSVLALSQLTAKEFDTLSGSVNDTGQAFRAAATRVDSAKGALEIFQGIIEAIQIQIGDKFLPILRGVTVGFADLATKAGPKVVAFFGGVAGTITRLVGKAKGLFDVFGDKGLAGVFAKLGLKGSALFLKKLGQLAGMFGFVGDGASSLGDTIKGAFQWLGDNLLPMLSKGLTSVMGFVTTVKGLFATFQAGGLFGSRSGSFGGTGLLAALGISPDVIQTVQTILDTISSTVSAFMTGGLFGGVALAGGEATATGGLLMALGISGQTVVTIQQIIQQVIATVGSLVTWWQTNWPIMQAVALTAGQVLQSVWAGIVASLAPVSVAFNQIGAIFTGLGITWGDVGMALLTATGIVFAGIGAVILLAISVVTSLVAAVATAVSTMITMWGSLVASVSMAIGGWLVFMQGVGTAISGIISGDWTKAAVGAQMAWEGVVVGLTGVALTILNLFSGLFATVLGFVGGFITSFVGFWQGLYDELVGNSIIPDMIDKIISLFTETEWTELGESIVNGILKGVTDNAFKVYEKLKGMALEALAQAGLAIGWGSPARAFIPLGASIPQGIIVGIQSQIAKVKAALDQLTTGLIHGSIGAARDEVEEFMEGKIENNKVKMALKQMSKIFHDNADAILNDADRVGKFTELALAGINFGAIGIGGITEDSAGVVGQAIDLWIAEFDKAVGANKEKIKKLKEELRQLQIQETTATITTANSLIDLAQSSANRLGAQVDTLAALLNTGATEFMFEGQLISATQAQDMLNGAMQEQVDIQDDLLALQQAQSRLGFLQTQLDLINQLNAAGLDATSILGDLNLGANASMADIVEASNRAIQALIGQAEQGLSGLGGIAGSQPVGGAGTPVTGSQPVNDRSFVLNINELNISNGMDVNNLVSLIRREAARLA
jgi:TP901 family phage tail tape measure protein